MNWLVSRGCPRHDLRQGDREAKQAQTKHGMAQSVSKAGKNVVSPAIGRNVHVVGARARAGSGQVGNGSESFSFLDASEWLWIGMDLVV